MALPHALITQVELLESTGDRVALLRNFHGWSQSELARRVGVKPQNIQQLEAGHVSQPRYLLRLAGALSAPVGLLVGDHKGVRENVSSYHSGAVQVPLVRWGALARSGGRGGMQDASEPIEQLPQPVAMGEDAFALQVEGASMEPRFRPGEIIYVDPAEKPRDQLFVVARLGTGEVTLRQLVTEGHQQYLKATNPDWPERIRQITSKDTIIGVVVFKGEKV